MARGKVSVIPPALLTWAILGRPCFSSSDKFLFCWADKFLFCCSSSDFAWFMHECLRSRVFVHGRTFLHPRIRPMTWVVGLLNSCPILLLFSQYRLYYLSSWKRHLFNLANNNNIFNFAFSNLWWLKKPRIGCMISSYFIIGLDLLPSCNDFFMWMTYASYLYISLLISCISRNKKEDTTLKFYYR